MYSKIQPKKYSKIISPASTLDKISNMKFYYEWIALGHEGMYIKYSGNNDVYVDTFHI